MWTSDGGQAPNQACVPKKSSGPSPAITLLQPPPTPEQRAMRAWGQTGSRPGFHVEHPEQKHPAPGRRNATGLRGPAGASGREAGRGSRCSEEERSPADTPTPKAGRKPSEHGQTPCRGASSRASRPRGPSVSPAPAWWAHGCERGGRHTQARASRVLPGVRGGTRSRDRPTPTTRSGAGHRAHPRRPWPCSPRGRGATATWTPRPRRRPRRRGRQPDSRVLGVGAGTD